MQARIKPLPNPTPVAANQTPFEVAVDYAPKPSYGYEVYRIFYDRHVPPRPSGSLGDFLLAAQHGVKLPPITYTLKDSFGLDFLLGEFPGLKKHIKPRMLREQFDTFESLMRHHVRDRDDLKLQDSLYFDGWLLHRRVER